MARRRCAPSPALAALLVASACTCKGGAGGAVGDPALAAIEARMPSGEARAIDARAGFLDGGLAYVALRPEAAVRWGQSLPLPEEAARDLAEASRELGVDLRSGDLLGYLGLDPAGTVTMTLARPLVRDPAALFDALATRPPRKVEGFPGIGDGELPPELRGRLGAVGIHSRIHAPATDPSRIAGLVGKIAPGRANAAEALCRDLAPVEFCYGDGSALVVLRRDGAALALDVFNFFAGVGGYDDAARVEAIQASLRAPPAALATLGDLRGDLVGYVDAPVIPAIAAGARLGSLASQATYLDDASLAESIDRARREMAALEEIRATRRLLRGLRGEATFGGGDIRATFAWEPVDADAAAAIDRLLAHPAALSSPTLAGLCADAVSCFRYTGLPDLLALSELATGTYAAPARAFGDALNAADELGGLAIFLETWPNLLGASHRWVKEEMRGPEAAILGGVIDSVSRYEGAGGAIRSLRLDRGEPRGDFVTYLRAASPEINLVRGLLGFAGVRFEALALQGTDARVETARLPEADFPGALFAVTDAGRVKIGDQDVEAGWLVIADAADRVTWLLGQPRDAVVHPSAYFELDLGRLAAALPDFASEMGSARAWIEGRTLRASFAVISGRPRIDLYFGKPPAAR